MSSSATQQERPPSIVFFRQSTFVYSVTAFSNFFWSLFDLPVEYSSLDRLSFPGIMKQLAISLLVLLPIACFLVFAEVSEDSVDGRVSAVLAS